MTRSKRLKPVAQFADSRQQDAAVALANYRRVYDEHENRLNELRGYRAEYLERFHAAGAAGMDAMQLQEYRAFIDRLDKAVAQQEAVVQAARQEYEQKKQAWLELRGRAKALDGVVVRYQEQEQQARERREQHESDERAQRCQGGGKN
jgi:flagellar FliJ protein